MKKNISRTIRKDVIEYKNELKKHGIKILKVILFGSVAKGTNDEYSDIDLALVSPIFGKDYHRERVELAILSGKINDNIEPHPLNPKDLDNKYYALSNEINKYGIEIK